MTDNVFAVEGDKVSSFIIDENSLKFSSQKHTDYASFQDAWDKKLSLAMKLEIKYDKIKAIIKEESDDDVVIDYTRFGVLPTNYAFRFKNKQDYDYFLSYFTQKQYYQKIDEKLTPFRAIRDYLIYVLMIMGFTFLAYRQAVDIANGTAEELHGVKGRLFNLIVNILGDKGVIAVGIVLTGYMIYKIWTRYRNPPHRVKLLPPN